MREKQRVRVLHVQCIKIYGGIDTVLLAFARGQKCYPALESYFAVAAEGRLCSELRAEGAPVFVLPPTRVRAPWTVLKARKLLLRYCRQHAIDAVIFHSPYPHALFAGMARRHGVLVVHWLHNETDGQHWLDRLARRTTPDLGVAVSEFIRKSYGNLFPGVNPLVMLPPVFDCTLACTPSERESIRSESGVPKDGVVILQACRMDPMKGHEVLFRALAQLRNDKAWVCWIAGGAQQPWETAYFNRLQQLATDLELTDRVRFLGQRSDMPRLLAAADILCQPNIIPEPSGTVFVEAMYRGIPVVTSALGGAVEMVDGSCGVLVPHNNPTAIAKSLNLLINNEDLRRNLGRSGPARGRDIADPAQKLELLHRSLLQRARRRATAA